MTLNSNIYIFELVCGEGKSLIFSVLLRRGKVQESKAVVRAYTISNTAERPGEG